MDAGLIIGTRTTYCTFLESVLKNSHILKYFEGNISYGSAVICIFLFFTNILIMVSPVPGLYKGDEIWGEKRYDKFSLGIP